MHVSCGTGCGSGLPGGTAAFWGFPGLPGTAQKSPWDVDIRRKCGRPWGGGAFGPKEPGLSFCDRREAEQLFGQSVFVAGRAGPVASAPSGQRAECSPWGPG